MARKRKKKIRRSKYDRNAKKDRRERRRLDELARYMAQKMLETPRRSHANETFFDCEGNHGCIPFGGGNDFQYCQNCFYVENNGCQKLHAPTRLFLSQELKIIER